MLKKLVCPFMAFVMVVALVVALPIMAADVPDELKTDYVAGDDGNLITNIPNGNLSINDGNVLASASDGVAILPATADLGEHSDWGFSGFHIDSKFNETWADASKKPVFAQGDKILFATKVRKAADATVDAKINIAYADAGRARKLYPDNYPSSSDGFNVTSTEWVDFKTVLTNPVADLDQYTNPTLGFAAGTKSGAKVEIDMATMYYGVEIPHDIEVTATNEVAKATIKNQLGDVYSGSQGSFTWYALTNDREAYVDGITFTDNGDGTVNINVDNTVAAGTYDIVAKSESYSELIKGAEIEVVNTKNDYTPADDGNIIDTIPYGNLDINDGNLSASAADDIATLTANNDSAANADHALQGFQINEKFISDWTADKAKLKFSNGTKILVSARVRKAADATQDAKINVAFSIPGSGNSGAWVYPDNYPSGFDVVSTEWTDFTAIITAKNDLGSHQWWELLFGFQNGTVAGAKVEIDLTSIYFGAEMPYDIEVAATNESATAKILNQLGDDYSGSQGGFTWYAMNTDRTAEVEGITVTDNGDGTAAVSVADTVAGGIYSIVAVSDTYSGFVKGAEIEVVSLKDDYTPADDGNIIDTIPYGNLDINDGNLSASSADNIATITANNDSVANADHALQGFQINGKFISDWTADKAKLKFSNGTKILVSAKVRKAADATQNAKINVAFSIGGSGNSGAWVYPDNYPSGFDVVSTEWTDFTAIITAKNDLGSHQWWDLLFGFQNGTVAGAKVEIDLTSIYFGVESIYDIVVNSDGSDSVEAGKDSTITYNAKLVNAAGVTGSIEQGTFTWAVMDEYRESIARNITVTANANNTATVNVSKDAEAGTYTVIAKSNLYPDFVRSATLVVKGETFAYKIYVSPEGNDNNQGTLTAPLKTVQAAQQKARQYKAEGKLPLEVVFRGGDYRFEESLVFGASDSGIDGGIVTYRAYEGEEVRFKGSKELDLSKANRVTDSSILARIRDGFKNKIRVIDLAEQGITASQLCTPADTPHIYKLDFNREFNGFYINGKSMDVSCWPNGDKEASYTFDDSDNLNKFTYTDTAPDRWASATNWWVTIFNSYDFIPLRMKGTSVDTVNNVISVGVGGSETPINNPYTPTWKAYNLLEEIDVGGEYYIDIENMKLYFLPPCDLSDATAEFDIIGDPVIKLQDAENITFSGIEFSQINDDGVVMTDVDNVDVVGCTFRDIGFRGLSVLGTAAPQTQQYATDDKLPYGKALNEVPTANDASYNMDIRGNVFYNTGSSAIHINGGNIDTLTPSNNIVENNSISKFAQHSYWDGVVVVGVGTKVRNNNVSDSPYHGIRIYGNDHIIEYNEVYDVIKNSNDAAAIYVGASPIARGSVIQYNYIHDIKTIKETKNNWEFGIYLDDCQQGITVKNNIIADVHGGIWSNGAGNYTIDANTIINATTGIGFGYNADAIPDSATRTAVANRIYNKDVYYAKYPALQDYVNGTSPKESSQANANIFCNVGTNMEYYNESWLNGNISTCTKYWSQDNPATHDGNNTVSESVFVDPAKQDYRVNSDNAESYYYPTSVTNTPDINAIGMTTNLTLNAQTSPFTATYPVNGATGIETGGLWLSWEDAFGATQYRVQVGTDPTFSSTLCDKVVYDSAADLSDAALSVDTTYYWRVTAINPSRDFGAEWTAEGKFTTLSTSIEDIFVADDGTVTAEIHTYGNGFTAANAVCYIASYSSDGQKLIEVVPQTMTLEAGKKYSFTQAFENYDKNETHSVKMYVWTNGFIPLVNNAESINISK